MQRALVLDNNRQPLSPCHPARARALLRLKRAAVYRRFPFTIILGDRQGGGETQPVELKLDSQGVSKMTFLCRVFGHRYTDRIPSRSIFFADNMYCCRCKIWSYDFPDEGWTRRGCSKGNGIIPNRLSEIRSLWITIGALVRRMIYRVGLGPKAPF